MDLATHLQAMWARRWLIVSITLAVTALAYGASAIQPKTWTASSRLQITVPGADLTSTVLADNVTSLQAQYVNLVDRRDFVVDAYARARQPAPRDGSSGVTASAPDSSNLLVLKAAAASPGEARRLADGASAALRALIASEQSQDRRVSTQPLNRELDRLSDQLADADAGSPLANSLTDRYSRLSDQLVQRQAQLQPQVRVFTAASTPQAATSPHPERIALLAFLVALVATAELVALVAAVRRGRGRFPAEPESEIRRLTGLPVVTLAGGRTRSAQVSPSESLLATIVSANLSTPRVIVVTGVSEEARTASALNLLVGVALADGGSVTVVRVGTSLGRDGHGKDISAPAAPNPEHGRLQSISIDMSQLRTGDAWSAELAPHGHHTVIVHAPPVTPHAQGVEVAVRTGGEVLLVMPKSARRRVFDQALQLLSVAGIVPQAVIIEGRRADVPRPADAAPDARPVADEPDERLPLAAGR